MQTKTPNNRNTLITGSRVIGNPNLTVFTDRHYQGLQVMQGIGPLCREHLTKLHQTIMYAVSDHPRTLAIRFDLRLPKAFEAIDEHRLNRCIGRFFASLNAKVQHDRSRARQYSRKAHGSRVRFVWCRESTDAKPHWHCVIFVNKDAYNSLGRIYSEHETMRSRIQSAWGSAIGLGWDESQGLVHFPDNGNYQINDKPSSDYHCGGIEGLQELYYRASYLCKLETKQWGRRAHSFGCSRG